ncbi:MAG: HAD family phosphatase [Odoribacteraceae bacterium]|jgi:putative hydrolase of the HAD superfamily|nr:HAD family phosphatase [Odoribacteraceae bacterium]
MIKNIIFDLGGVVVEYNPALIISTFTGNPALKKYVTDNGFFREPWTEFDRGTLTKQELAAEGARLSGCPAADCEALIDHMKRCLVSIPETGELIAALARRGFRLYCLSNMSLDHYDYLKNRPVFAHFHGQVISALEGLVKPERAFYELILERYRLLPDETLFIDDLQRNLLAAAELGIHTVHFAERESGLRAILEAVREADR